MRRHIVPLFAANIVALGAVGISYFVYSRLLSAADFGAYAAALAVGNLAVLVLDGGIKASIIKHAQDLTCDEQFSLLVLMLGFSVVLLVAVHFGQDVIVHFYPAAAAEIRFVSVFAAVYLVTYPWIGLLTASSERNLLYSRLAWIESLGTVMERGVPAVFLLCTGLGLNSFVAGLVLGRIMRIAFLRHGQHIPAWGRMTFRSGAVGGLLREGLMYQLGGLASMIRDNLHVLIVGPLFGASWVGYYAWGLQLVTISSQAFVQISARVALAVTARTADFRSRWDTIRQQVALLTAATAPILVVVIVIAPSLNRYFFSNKWTVALTLLPWLSARMIPGVACTPVGALLLVSRGGANYAAALWLWTATELAGAYAASLWFGATGLAVSYALIAWIGLFCLSRRLEVASSLSRFAEICGIICGRPALWLSTIVASSFLAWGYCYGVGIPVWVICASMLCLAFAYVMDSLTRSIVFQLKR